MRTLHEVAPHSLEPRIISCDELGRSLVPILSVHACGSRLSGQPLNFQPSHHDHQNIFSYNDSITIEHGAIAPHGTILISDIEKTKRSATPRGKQPRGLDSDAGFASGNNDIMVQIQGGDPAQIRTTHSNQYSSA